MLIFVDLPVLFKSLRCVISRKWRSPRRVLWTCIALVAVTAVYAINVIFRLLDEVLFPAYRDVAITSPVIITGNPRSGTTFLNRLLCADEDSFVYFRLYQTIFPSITIWKIIDRIAEADRACGGSLATLVKCMNEVLFSGWKNIHEIGFNAPEEDEALFLFNFATPAIYMLFPFFDEVPELSSIDRLPAWKRDEIARYYEGCLKRLVYAYGEGKTLLCKSVLLPGRIETLLSRLPDARVIYLVRDPCDAISSTVRMFTSFWRVHSPDIPSDSDTTRGWVRLCVEYYRRFHEYRGRISRKNLMPIPFTEFVADPDETVKKIYNVLGLTLSEEYLARVREEAARRSVSAKGVNSLARYGVEPEWIHAELKEIYDEYNIPCGMIQGERDAQERR